MPIPTTTTLNEQTVGNIPTEKPTAAKKAAKKPTAAKKAAKKPAPKKSAGKKAGNTPLSDTGTPKTKKNASKTGGKTTTKGTKKGAGGSLSGPNSKKTAAKAAAKSSKNGAALSGNLIIEGTLDESGWHAVLALAKQCSDVTSANNKPSKLVWKKHNASLTIDGDKFKLVVPRKEAAKIPGDFTWFENYRSE